MLQSVLSVLLIRTPFQSLSLDPSFVCLGLWCLSQPIYLALYLESIPSRLSRDVCMDTASPRRQRASCHVKERSRSVRKVTSEGCQWC